MFWRTILTTIFVLWHMTSAFAAVEGTEQIESDISSRNIAIESNFTGQAHRYLRHH